MVIENKSTEARGKEGGRRRYFRLPLTEDFLLKSAGQRQSKEGTGVGSETMRIKKSDDRRKKEM